MNIIKEIWNKRLLIQTFAINDLVVRYRNSILGFFWSILEPLLMLTILYVVFTQLFKSQIENYPLYLLLGLIMWNFFSRSTGMSLTSLLSKAGIVTKIYFPREILPLSSCITALIMLTFEMIIFFVFVLIFRFIPPTTIILLPGLLMIEFILTLGISFPLSIFNVRYRDIQHIWNLLLYAGFFISPVIYSTTTFPPKIRDLFMLNPMAQILEMSHNAVIYGTLPSLFDITYLLSVSFGIFIIGYLIFRKYQSKIIEEL